VSSITDDAETTTDVTRGRDEPARLREWLPTVPVEGAAARRRNHTGAVLGLHRGDDLAGARLGTALSVVAAGLPEGPRVTRTEEFEELRPLLFAIAYRKVELIHRQTWPTRAQA
jgi:hypothetical protein